MRERGDYEKKLKLKKGEWLKDEGAAKKKGLGEDFLVSWFGPNCHVPSDGSLLAMTALKLKYVKDLEAKLKGHLILKAFLI